jgi:NADPH-dependent 2,4-dienoyl-CoA reductase/sulfur reductase-like enzyme
MALAHRPHYRPTGSWPDDCRGVSKPAWLEICGSGIYLLIVSTFSHDKDAPMTRSRDAMKDRSIATNVSSWESPYPAMGKTVPPEVSRVQVCVIGAGIAGLTTTYLMAKEGLKVLVLEEREIGRGQRTSRSCISTSTKTPTKRANNEKPVPPC